MDFVQQQQQQSAYNKLVGLSFSRRRNCVSIQTNIKKWRPYISWKHLPHNCWKVSFVMRDCPWNNLGQSINEITGYSLRTLLHSCIAYTHTGVHQICKYSFQESTVAFFNLFFASFRNFFLSNNFVGRNLFLLLLWLLCLCLSVFWARFNYV